ncbi:hypothetical protein FA95DRAFT_1567446 [Auriscalpium vulgare]|uniref:Uncharacterized protein n=1 Tax=Auriscalpium vulgare TaxID=40419 RepID=A0ACB8R4F0_9AGAM|nr:hypothetical protein FA95DRAFT_1567446 [Auriscalpium vulgare]
MAANTQAGDLLADQPPVRISLTVLPPVPAPFGTWRDYDEYQQTFKEALTFRGVQGRHLWRQAIGLLLEGCMSGIRRCILHHKSEVWWDPQPATQASPLDPTTVLHPNECTLLPLDMHIVMGGLADASPIRWRPVLVKLAGGLPSELTRDGGVPATDDARDALGARLSMAKRAAEQQGDAVFAGDAHQQRGVVLIAFAGNWLVATSYARGERDARVTDAIAKPASDADDGMWFPGRAPEDAGPPVNYEHVFDGYVWEKTLIPPDRWAGPFLLGTPEALNFFIQLKAYLHELRTLPPFV